MLLPHLGADSALAGLTLALVSTFAGKLLLVGSIANLIGVDLAARQGIAIDRRRHAQTGLPVDLGPIALLWLWLVA